MAETRKASTRQASTDKVEDAEPVDPKGSDVGGSCNVAGCLLDEEIRGLCESHWYTHRGLANPDEDAPKVEKGTEVALP